MSAVPAERGVAEGYEALSVGDWQRARTAFELALTGGDDPEALDGLGRVLWWLREAELAVVHRERAYAGFRREGDLARAARIALWLSREHTMVWGNDAAARGWLARAERLLDGVAGGSATGWLALSRAERATHPSEAVALCHEALGVARQSSWRLSASSATRVRRRDVCTRR